MPDIQKIKLPDGTSYDIMDANAIHDPSEKSADNYLKYNGTEWTAESIPTTSHILEGTELVIETDLGRDTSEFLKVTGGTMTGNLDMGENVIKLTDNSSHIPLEINKDEIVWRYWPTGSGRDLASISGNTGLLNINALDVINISGRGLNFKSTDSIGSIAITYPGFEQPRAAIGYDSGYMSFRCGRDAPLELASNGGIRFWLGGSWVTLTQETFTVVEPEVRYKHKINLYGDQAITFSPYDENHNNSCSVVFDKSTYLGGLSDPIKYNDAATKSYVDNKLMEFPTTTKITAEAGKVVTNKIWEGFMSSIAVFNVYPTNLPASCLFSYNVGSDALSLIFYNAGEQSLSETSINIVVIGEYKDS